MATTNTTKKDVQAFLVGGIFILTLVFATYKYFQNSNPKSDDNQRDQSTVAQKVKDLLSTSTTREDDSNAISKQLDKNSEKNKEQANTATTAQETGTWTATDYKQGDINKGSYTVKSGDTLWEISEAVYGNGALWSQLLTANSKSIGFLPDGSQALIIPGQVLTIP